MILEEVESALQSYGQMLQDANDCDDMLQHGAAVNLGTLKNLERHASDASMKLEKIVQLEKGGLSSFDTSSRTHGANFGGTQKHM